MGVCRIPTEILNHERPHQVTKEYVVDLQEPEEDRWSEVIQKEGKTAKALIRSATRDFLGYDPLKEAPTLLSAR